MPQSAPKTALNKTGKNTQHYHGHRQRLRERFLQQGAESFQPYELLELQLFACIKQGDTKPLAKKLIKHFGSYTKVLAAPQKRLMEVDGCGPATALFLKQLQASAVLYAKQSIDDKTLLSSWSAVINYLRAAMAHNDKEQFRILFLDKKNHLIADEMQQEGTIDHTPVYPREVAKRALELAATAIILVHNHPSGDPTPSRQDIEMTHKIQNALSPLNIVLHDHIIISRASHASFKGLNII
ncbi:RadC family protein [Polycladidibacter stylochi]|uniref:RadC family protein n=1 Tax=Polycladidibacter stylochi TaxID=1807766 RepID=UPI000830794A|nr:DNA repair protein RadC [Pseudovibrio stylochi]